MLFFWCSAAALVQLCRAMMVQGLWCDGPQGCGVQRCECSQCAPAGVLHKPETGDSLPLPNEPYRRKMACMRASYSEALASERYRERGKLCDKSSGTCYE